MGCKHLRLYYGNRCCKTLSYFFKGKSRLKRDSRTKRDGESMSFIKELSSYAIPALIFVILSAGIYKGVKVYDVFLEGQRKG